MYVSMNPKGETGKVIHISQNDTNREVEFIPFDQNGLVKTTSDETVAHINSIKGNTVSFNQLVENGNFADTSGWNAADCTFTVSNNIATVVSSTTSGLIYRDDYSIPSGHKILIKLTSNSPNPFFTRIYNPSWSQLFNGLFTKNGNSQYLFYTATDKVKIIYMSPNHAGTSTIQNVQIFDLTLMGIDSLTTTAEVEAWLSSHIGVLPYYDYTQGTLIPFKGTGLKTVGKNLFDKEWTNAVYNGYLGNNSIVSSANGEKTFVLPIRAGTYKILKPQTLRFRVGTKLSLGSGACVESYDFTPTQTEVTFTSTIDGYMYIYGLNNTGETLTVNDILNALQVQSASITDTTYEPYTSNTLPLPTSTYFPTGIKVVPDYTNGGDIADELTPSKAITRIGSVDLGTLDYTPSLASDGTYEMFSNAIQSIVKKPSQNTEIANINCAKYIVRSRGGSDGTYFGNDGISIGSNGFIFIYDKNYNTSSSASSLKDSLSNVYLYFELLTSTETDISLDLTYPVWDGGTEQILSVNGSTPTTSPIKANITYPDRTEDTEFLYKQTSFVFTPRTWAFVCKNITQALTLVGDVLKGTIPSGMTSESGKFPLKVKMTDDDGVCFSEKIDLFVERKP